MNLLEEVEKNRKAALNRFKREYGSNLGEALYDFVNKKPGFTDYDKAKAALVEALAKLFIDGTSIQKTKAITAIIDLVEIRATEARNK